MTRKTHLARCATIAIAATLALPSTSLLAQDVAAPAAAPAPVIVVPTVEAAPAAPVPTIVIPDVTAVEEPAAAPAAQPARTTPTTRAATTNRTTPRPAAAAPVTDTATTTAIPADTAPVEIAPIAAAPAAEPVLAPEPAPTAEANGLDDATLFGLGAIGILGLAAILFAATRRRRPRTSPEAAAPRIERPIVQREPAAAIPAGTAAPEFAAGLEPAPSVSYAPATFAAPRPMAQASSLSHTGAAVALPREIPSTFEERDALLRRMIAAKPDRANPFRSPKARARRARMIIASLGRDFSNAEPRIDLSQYPSNWPEVARRHSAAA